MHLRQDFPGAIKQKKGLLHETRNGREKCESPYFYAFFGRFVPGKAFSICINYCVFIDQACGTGGMLSTAYSYLKHYNPTADVRLFGQELMGQSSE